jgi:hypothetical protein
MRRLRVPALSTQSHTAMTTKAFTLVVLVGFLACVSGNEMSFSLLYLVVTSFLDY